jgi:hypothetical protein
MPRSARPLTTAELSRIIERFDTGQGVMLVAILWLKVAAGFLAGNVAGVLVVSWP